MTTCPRFLTMVFSLAPLLCFAQGPPATAADAGRLRVFLDCGEEDGDDDEGGNCYADYVRLTVAFVDYVRDPLEADVQILVKSSSTGGGGEERAVTLIGLRGFAGVQHNFRAVSEAGESEDVQRRGVASAITIGLLNFAARAGVTGDLDVAVNLGTARASPVPARDPWKNWVFSLNGQASVEAEETSREMELETNLSADRITEALKVSVGAMLSHQREDFDLDQAEPVRAARDEREFEWVAVKSMGDHWSAGARGQIESSSFENIVLASTAAPAIEFNVFPYASYARRQLRMLYSVGVYSARYQDETLYGKLQESLGRQEISLTLEQRQTWGSLEARIEASNYLPGFSRHRVEGQGQFSLRVARGLSLTFDGTVTRIRDQLALPRRGATPEEVLLRLRRLRSDYEYDVAVGFTYTFGSIFSTIVNPRFGR